MARPKTLLCLLVLAFTLFSRRSEAESKMTVREVVYRVEHQPDGHKYPSYLKETYELTPGHLRYSAYFGGMPIDMNHMDSAEWSPSGLDAAVLATALKLAEDAASGLLVRHDSAPSSTGGNGIYLVAITQNNSDSMRFVEDQKSKAWAELDAAFQKMVAAFHKETGRPLKATELPQRAAEPPPLTRAVALQLALKAANQALEQSYAQSAKSPDAVAPARTSPWVTVAEAQVTGDAAHGFTIVWARHPPAGFGLDATVQVSPQSEVTVVHAAAMYSPD